MVYRDKLTIAIFEPDMIFAAQLAGHLRACDCKVEPVNTTLATARISLEDSSMQIVNGAFVGHFGNPGTIEVRQFISDILRMYPRIYTVAMLENTNEMVGSRYDMLKDDVDYNLEWLVAMMAMSRTTDIS